MEKRGIYLCVMWILLVCYFQTSISEHQARAPINCRGDRCPGGEVLDASESEDYDYGNHEPQEADDVALAKLLHTSTTETESEAKPAQTNDTDQDNGQAKE